MKGRVAERWKIIVAAGQHQGMLLRQRWLLQIQIVDFALISHESLVYH
jgi:hypothetical protein